MAIAELVKPWTITATVIESAYLGSENSYSTQQKIETYGKFRDTQAAERRRKERKKRYKKIVTAV